MVQLKLRLKKDAQFVQDRNSGCIKWQTARGEQQKEFSDLTPGLSLALQKLANGGITRQSMYDSVIELDGMHGMFRLQHSLRLLDTAGLMHHELHLDDNIQISLKPHSSYFRFQRLEVDPRQKYLLSRFALMRRDEEGGVLESPQGTAFLLIHNPKLVAYLSFLIVNPESCITMHQQYSDYPETFWQQIFCLLLNANLLTSVDDNGAVAEECDSALRQWEFHDLLFHARTRLGRNIKGYGDTYRFWSEIKSPPMIKQVADGHGIALSAPHKEDLIKSDMPLIEAMESRQSIRHYDDANPINLEQVGHFLFRTARIKEQIDIEKNKDGYAERWTLSKRAYPSGGARHGLELYLTVRHCDGLEPGFYHYDPLNHYLAFLSPPTAMTNRLLKLGTPLPHSDNVPQILITIGARFQRVSWKYEGIAYALLLKECGVLYQSMYLVATAMGLAACALGGGDADLFAQVAHTDYYSESSIGEFALGSRYDNQSLG